MLFENAPVVIFEVDISGIDPVILTSNRRAEAVYGWSITEFVKVNPTELIPEESQNKILNLIDSVRSGKTALLETTNFRRDGSIFPVRLIATPAGVPPGSYMIVTVEDISSQRERRSEIEAIDAERRRIAQEIHDGVAQDLASIRLKLCLWRDWIRLDPDRLLAEIDQTEKTLDSAIAEIRRSIYALRPVALDEVGLVKALTSYINDFNNQHNIYISLQVDTGNACLPVELELPIFRIVQEALNNIALHAEASLAWVQLAHDDSANLSLNIRDNGQGFNLANLKEAGRQGHLGLIQMRERIEKAGGKLSLSSQPGKGMEISVKFQL
jgi:PAS domain S-box-containing protein